MFHTTATHTVTVRRPSDDTGELVSVDVVIKKGKHEPGAKGSDVDLALDLLWACGLAHDDARPHNDAVTDIVTGDEIALDNPTTTDPAQEG